MVFDYRTSSFHSILLYCYLYSLSIECKKEVLTMSFLTFYPKNSHVILKRSLKLRKLIPKACQKDETTTAVKLVMPQWRRMSPQLVLPNDEGWNIYLPLPLSSKLIQSKTFAYAASQARSLSLGQANGYKIMPTRKGIDFPVKRHYKRIW